MELLFDPPGIYDCRLTMTRSLTGRWRFRYWRNAL